jgi:hypothetical protein
LRRWVLTAALVAAAAVLAPSAGAHVLRVGTYKGVPGQFSSIQAAVSAAKPNDWVLVAPGDYKTTSSSAPSGHPEFPAGVLITQSGLYLRGMNRNKVVVDGTKSGSQCSSTAADQNFGPAYNGGSAGLNGVEIWKANNVWVQNLTVCNFLGGTGDAGNGVWWNGGANSGKVGGYGYFGSNLTATSTFFQSEKTAATYGIFSSNWSGGMWDQTYASNFNDSGYYIGACQQICNQTVNHAWGEYNALGYSGSNSGGQLLVENSQFDNNQDGFDTNSQNGDNPPPQDGACPNNGISPITHTHSCWVFMNNYVHDNNNAQAPSSGSAAQGPVGTGMSVSGARDDTIMNNTFANNGAWGTIFVPYPDSGPPCTGGTPNYVLLGAGSCLYDEWGDALLNNKYTHNGYFGNPTNGDFEELNFEGGHPTDCFSGNTDTSGKLNSASAALETQYPSCTGKAAGANTNGTFLTEVLCDSGTKLGGVSTCLPTDHYPKLGNVVMHQLPAASKLPSMSNACSGVPSDPWCSGQTNKIKKCVASSTIRVSLPLSVGEKRTSVSVAVTGFPKHGGGGSSTGLGKNSVSVSISGWHHGKIKVHIVEHIKVGSHKEKISFTNVYKHC